MRERIVVVTNTKANSLRNLSIEFDYVFMDEANHAHIPESLVPMHFLKTDDCLVVSGDQMQLDGYVGCFEGMDYGLDTSLLDKLLKFNEYQVGNENSGDYITRLMQSYRCDERILAISNELFYENEASCLNKTPQSILNMMRLTGPVQFVPVPLESSEEEALLAHKQTEREADCVVDLVIKLYKIGFEPEQIGIYVAHKPQEVLKKLNEAIRANNRMLDERYPIGCDWRCKIGRAAHFQGDEREIIIISTASDSTDPDKKEYEHRFNLTISRARWLMIVVGDPNLLGKRGLWSKLVDNSIKGEIGKWQTNLL